MNAMELYKAQRSYTTGLRQMEANRYAATQAFRMAHKEDLGFFFDPTTMDLPLEEVGRRMTEQEYRVLVAEKALAGEELCEEELSALGVSAEEYRACRQSLDPIKEPIPDGLVIMTFDDSTLDHFTAAAPILESFGAHGSFFTCECRVGLDGGTGFSDKSRYMTWEQIAGLSERGHEIANHSLNHNFAFLRCDAGEKTAEISGLERRCVENGIRKPTAFGYPGGACDKPGIELLHALGYRWARGDYLDSGCMGQRVYDPLLDCPLAVPSFNGAPMFDEKQLRRVVSLASKGRIAVLAYHGVNGPDFGPLSLEKQLECIYRSGGRCISFADLEKYVDPEKAYRYWAL